MSSLVEACRGGPLTLLLDYDGTLVPIAPAPSLAVPDSELIGLLGRLAARPHIALHIVSGRAREPLEAWFGELPLSLWAEHGFWHRPQPGLPWTAAAAVPTEALGRVRPLLDQVTADTPGSFIEEKSASAAWHYRRANPDAAARGLTALRAALRELLADTRLEFVEGKKVLEVRLRGINKGMVGRRVLSADAPAGPIVAIGDDETDEDLFRSMPDSAITIGVGPGQTHARLALADHDAVRDLLSALLVQ